MPPKAKFTREQVVATALAIVQERGESALTARELGAKLNSSARPIFTLFSGMEEVAQETARAARDLYNRQYIAEGLKEELAFRGVGRAYLRFAQEQPQLFRLLFMGKNHAKLGSVLPQLDENYAAILSSITSAYGVSNQAANHLYRQLWIYTHGIAALYVTGTCTFTEEETNVLLTDVFLALLYKVKREERQ